MKTLSCLLFAGLIGWIAPAWAESPGDPGKIADRIKVEQKTGERIPLELEFWDEEGRPVKLADFFKGRPVLLTPVYYKCPMLCTLILNSLVEALRDIPYEPGRDFEIVSFTINPEETASLAKQKKRTYVASYGNKAAAGHWHFLNGPAPSITALTEALGFGYAFDEKSGEYAHPAAIMMLSPDGVISRYFMGMDVRPTDLRLGVVDASQGRVRKIKDLIMLSCFRYDHQAGKYTLAVTRILRVAAGLTVAVVALTVVLLVRRDGRAGREGKGA